MGSLQGLWKKEERRMKLTNHEWLRAGRLMGLLSMAVCLMGMILGSAAQSQAISTTTVQGTVYLANGQPGTGTLMVSWPSFTTASGQLVVAGKTTVTIAPDGFMSVNLAPNQGATPAGLYYTAVYYLSDGTTNTQYWVVPAAAQATLGQIQSQLMPAAQAVQAVSKSYVDQAIAALAGGTLTVSGTTMTGPLTLCCDPTQPLQAADKHYVDENVALAVPLTGGTMTGALTATKIGGLFQVDQFAGADFGAKLSACLSGLSSTNGGICDARNFTGTLPMGSSVTISTANATVLLPCATISTGHQLIVTAGTRNVSLRGCSLRGASTASGSQGGTMFLYSGTGAMVQVGDPTYAADTTGFHLDNAAINTTAATSATSQGLLAYRAQELDLESLYFLGNSNQTGMTLDGTGNYTGGSFEDNAFTGFQTAVNAIGHQIPNPATTDWMNASTFVRLHIDCPTSNGSPIAGTYGINLQQGDGNTFTGGDVEGCAAALHLGANAQNNTIVGLRNENSTNQVVADAGSLYNDWMTGGTMFTGQLTDNGTRNSFLDTFHRSFNGLNGDWYGSQKDATVTNHYRVGTGAGNERGLLDRYQTDYGYRWTMGLSDATAGEQFYQILDELNNVYRISVGQYNNGQLSTNNQTVINAAGSGAVVLNGSNNSGTGGVVIGSGGPSETTVATIGNTGNAQFNGTLQVGGTTTLAGTPTVKNQADAEIDSILWAGLTTSQKESFSYKDWNGNSQWYMVKDASNNWALNSATGGLDSFKAYQSGNSGDTYIDASNPTGVVRINYETGAGTGFNIYGGNSSSLYASFTGTTSIKFPGLAASSGHFCLQIDNSGYISNTGAACGSGGGGGSGTVNSGTSGQIAYYSASGTAVSGTNTVPITAGGTGASTASGALANLLPGVTSNGANGVTVAGNSQLNGTLQVGGVSTFTGSTTVANQADAEIDSILQAGATTSQKESFSYKDWNGNGQWTMVKDASNNWALNSGTGGLDSFKAYQSTNSGDTYINASNASGIVRINYESGSGAGLNIYGGSNSSLYASFTGTTAIKFPGLSAISGHNCLQIDNSGFISNTGAACGTGSMNGTISAGASGQIAYYSGNGTAVSGTNTVSVTAGGTGSSTASGALANLGGAGLAGAAFTGPVSVSTTLSVANNISIGPRYDVTNPAFGAKGDATTDDTLAIQAAFDACYHGGVIPYGGVVEFPGPHTYVVSSTINAHDSCQIEGVIGSSSVENAPPRLQWNSPSAGAVSAITAFSITSNVVTFTAANSLTTGQWVEIQGLTAGYFMNRTIAQVLSTGLSGTQFEMTLPQGWSNVSTTTDSGTATTANVMVAFDSIARYDQSVSNIALVSGGTGQAYNVGFYFDSRVDTGTRVANAWVSGATEYSYYFAAGGINVEFDKGWRSDGAGVSGIYWRVTSADSFGMANGTVDNSRNGYGSPTSGAAVMLDNAACANTSGIHFTARNVKIEINTSLTPGLGAFTMYDCPSNSSMEAFWLDLENTWVAPASAGTAGFNFPSFVMSPANDAAMSLNILNGQFPSGTSPNTTTRWSGIPELLRTDLYGSIGWIPQLSYAPSTNSDGGYYPEKSPISLIGDVNVSQLWHYGIQSSDFLYSDTAFAALPNGTTLFAGQILAPPGYWSGANGKRYALDVVYQGGTTGTPNGGATTCTGSSGTSVLTCTNATDLSVGQRITVGTDANKTIAYVDATNPSVVLVNLESNLGATHSTATALSFSAPILGPEIQIPTKSSSAPSSLAWSQGDMEQNSAATANGVAAWVNVAAGTPGTWAGVPLGNSSGQIAASQIASASLQGTDTKVLTAGIVSGTATPLCTDGNGGATTSGCSTGAVVTNTPPWLMNLGTGADGSYEYSSTASCTTGPTHCVVNCTASSPCSITAGEVHATQFQVDSGAYVYDNLAGSGPGLVIHSQGACNDFGTTLVNGSKNGWPNTNKGVGGASSGGSGGGTAAGTVGVASFPSATGGGNGQTAGGSAGAVSGGNGGNGLTIPTYEQRAFFTGGAGGLDGLFVTGAAGVQGANSGGLGGYPGGSVIQMCASINGTGGIIDASGSNGNPATANSTGAGSGGGGGVVILSSQAAVSTWPGVYVAGGPGGLATVPEALGTSGSCTTQPKATLGVTSGALNGACTVVQAGAGCGTGTNVTFSVVGGGGTLGTGTVNPTWSGGTLASCTTTAGTSSGYTAATYTTAGTGGDGGNGWYAEFQGW